MGQLISLDERRAAAERAKRSALEPDQFELAFHYELDSAFTYLAAERLARGSARVRWCPLVAPRAAGEPRLGWEERTAVERRADALGLPLVWPDPPGLDAPQARRVGAFAASQGRGAAFTLAAGRLAFCGGFHLDDPEVLAEAIAAARLELGACLRAALDPIRDHALAVAGGALVAAGATRLPAARVGGRLFCGEQRLGEALAMARAGRGAAARPAESTS